LVMGPPTVIQKNKTMFNSTPKDHILQR